MDEATVWLKTLLLVPLGAISGAGRSSGILAPHLSGPELREGTSARVWGAELTLCFHASPPQACSPHSAEVPLLIQQCFTIDIHILTGRLQSTFPRVTVIKNSH